MFKKFYLSNAAIALSLCAALQLNGAENNATSANISAPGAGAVNSAAPKNASGANATKLGTIVVTATGFEDMLKTRFATSRSSPRRIWKTADTAICAKF